MNSKVQHPFSIDFITREALGRGNANLQFSMYNNERSSESVENLTEKNCRQTPSPTDSGLESDHSPSRIEAQKSAKDNTVSEVRDLSNCI